MYAIVTISGKQFKATKGLRIRVPKQNSEPGTTLTFDNVLLTSDGKDTVLGNPNVKGASVTAKVLENKRDKKILIYKKKRRKGYQRKNGHRQWFTEVEIKTINTSAKKAKPKAEVKKDKKESEKVAKPSKKED
jgi:large subunit ribosomal protein L21